LFDWVDIDFVVGEVKDLKKVLEDYDFPMIEPRKISKSYTTNSNLLFDQI